MNGWPALADGGFLNPGIAAGVAGLPKLFAAGTVLPSAVLGAYLDRIETFNPGLNAFLTLDAERAMRDAHASGLRWAAAKPLSPLDGVTIGVKANIAVEGLPWHGGIAAYAARIAKQDAECVATLRRAGAIIIGILNMHEAGLGATNDNIFFGRCHNPYRHGFTPGGSSGGSASAVAAGLCAAALGTDTMGSVRIPAAFCGVFGYKPAHGAVPMEGIMPLSITLDDAGILARDARDLLAVIGVIAPPAAATVNPGQIRCGIVQFLPHIGADLSKVQEFAAAAGWRVDELTMDDWDAAAMRRLSLLIVETEALAAHREMWRLDPSGFSPELAGMLGWAARQPPAKIAQAHQQLDSAAAHLRQVFSGFDAILTPMTAEPAFDFAGQTPASLPDYTLLANISGLPAIALPIGLSEDGLPLSAQIITADAGLAMGLAGRLARPVPPPSRFR